MSGIRLTAVEARVLGCLIEKELTTPDYYPLTLNALTSACNQSSNRDPVVSYDEATVNAGIEGLREKRLVRWVKEARSRSSKYRHDLESVPNLSVPERSLVAVLLLRGTQTAGELRTRTERYCDFPDLESVDQILERLAGLDEPITEKLDRRPGQKEARWRQLWTAASDDEPPAAALTVERLDDRDRPPEPSLADQLARLEARVARLERELGLG